jgi:hypothetical protein
VRREELRSHIQGLDLLGFFEPFIPIKRLRLGWVDVAA